MMKSVKGFGRGWPILGTLAICMLACGLDLEGAPNGPRSASPKRVDTTRSESSIERAGNLELLSSTQNAAKVTAGKYRAGVRLPDDGYPIADKITVDPYADEASQMRARGELVGPWRPQVSSNVAAGGCTFHQECNDCDPCTTDLCVIDAANGPGSGFCQNTPLPNGSVGGCSDGNPCNGIETCQGRVCGADSARVGESCVNNRSCGVCSGGRGPDAVCSTDADCGACDGVSANAGALCDDDVDCDGGSCITGTCDPGTCEGVGSCEPVGSGTGLETPICVRASNVCEGGRRDGLACDPINSGTDCGGTCSGSGSNCLADSDCGVCDANSGNLEGSSCSEDFDCLGGTCVDQGETCQRGSCDNGDPCSVDGDCNAGTCTQPTCVAETRVCDLLTDGAANLDELCVTPCTVSRCAVFDSTSDFFQEYQAGTEGCVDDNDCEDPGTGLTASCISGDDVCLANDNNRQCNGTETCDPDGTCRRDGLITAIGDNPCGTDSANCAEFRCVDTAMLRQCDPTIAAGQTGGCPNGPAACQKIPGNPVCFPGRCCTSTGGGEFSCERLTNAQCLNAGGFWYPGEAGTFTIGLTCSESDGAGCPKYGAGIAPIGSTDFLVGPITYLDRCDSNLRALGDDYSFSNGSFLPVSALRFIGGGNAGGGTGGLRISFEFYDANEQFIEDIFFPSGGGVQVREVSIDPPLVLPPDGYVVARIAGAFSPNAAYFWATTDSVDVGTNDDTVIWVDDGVSLNGPQTNWLTTCDATGAWCDPAEGGADCAGTCVPAPAILPFELVAETEKVNEPLGACCDPTSGDCTEITRWECQARTSGSDPVANQFAGVGTLCAACDSGLNQGSPCRTCVGGGTPGLECNNDDDCSGGTCEANDSVCRVCDENSDNPLDPCTTDGDCPNGTCASGALCEAAMVCGMGACCNPDDGVCSQQPDQGTCEGLGGVWQGFGTDCDPNCCPLPPELYTGGDYCNDATVNVVTVPGQNDPPVVVTITGTNANATSPVPGDGQQYIDFRCTSGIFDTQQPAEDVDFSWWESFSIDDCAYVIIDFCCSDPIRQPAWVLLWDACPCGDGNVQINRPNPNRPDLVDANERGGPICDEDNLWAQYGPLPTGTYYYPVFSAVVGATGQYQMHITVQACPNAACCRTACVGGANAGLSCQVDEECPNGACEAVCEELNILECRDADGFYLGLPNKSTPVFTCGDGSVCQTGSCCTGPGECVDVSGGALIGKDDCDLAGGVYNGGIRCYGGVCADGLTSCRTLNDCPNGIACNGSLDDREQRTPCPVCTFQSNELCQFSDGQSGGGFVSDTCVAGCFPNAQARVADDFRALGDGAVTQVCLEGFYGENNGTFDDCGDSGVVDDFSVRIFEDAGGVPGAVLGSVANPTVVAREIAYLDNGGDAIYGILMDLGDGIGPINSGEVYWIEILNRTDPDNGGAETCDFLWVPADDGQGNEYSIQSLGPNYNGKDLEFTDMTWCIDIPFDSPDVPTQPCCVCDARVCFEGTAEQCLQQDGAAQFGVLSCEDTTCPETTPQENDNCSGAIAVSDGTVAWSNFCADDGPTTLNPLNDCEGADPIIGSDIWYEYTATCTGPLTIDTCDLQGTEGDTVIAVYTDGSSTCACPNDQTSLLDCNDDDCVFTGRGSELIFDVVEGQCLLIRVGGFETTDTTGILNISCAQPPDVNSLPLNTDPTGPGGAALACDGGDNNGRLCSTCSGGTRNGQPCYDNLGCSGGGTCVANASLCPGVKADGTTAATCDRPAPWPKARFVTVEAPPSEGVQTAIRLEIVAAPTNPSIVGQRRWVQSPADFFEGDSLTPQFGTWKGSALGCDPVFLDWEPVGPVNIYGDEVVPNGVYEVRQGDTTCVQGADIENCLSAPTYIVMGDYGDVLLPLQAGTSLAQPDIADILAAVDKFLGVPSALTKPRVTQVPAIPKLNTKVDLSDILGIVDSFLGQAYSSTPADPNECGGS